MSGFTGRLALDFGDWGPKVGRYARLLGPVVWTSTAPGLECTVVLPEGYMSDGGTVPRWLWWLMPRWGDETTLPALLHDFILECLDDGTPAAPCLTTRRRCDATFRVALVASGVGRPRALALWLGVRFCSLTLPLWPAGFGRPPIEGPSA